MLECERRGDRVSGLPVGLVHPVCAYCLLGKACLRDERHESKFA